jgi:pimeloyl-ACP methyl ester carboxylesterase
MALFGVDIATLRSGRTGSIQGFQSLKDLDHGVLLAYLDGQLIEGFNAESLLPQVTCPTLLLQGNTAEGGFMSDQGVKRALELLPDGRHAFFPDSGHWLHVQQPSEVAETASTFLAAV